jgi:hypothetical protein
VVLRPEAGVLAAGDAEREVVALAERRYADADAWADTALSAGRALAHPRLIFITRANQALASLFRDALDEARNGFAEALTIWRDAGYEAYIDETLLGLAAVAARDGEAARAARLAGAAKLHELPRSPDEEVIWSRLSDETLAPARERHGADRWDAGERDGASLSLREAIDLGPQRGQFAPSPDQGRTISPS